VFTTGRSAYTQYTDIRPSTFIATIVIIVITHLCIIVYIFVLYFSTVKTKNRRAASHRRKSPRIIIFSILSLVIIVPIKFCANHHFLYYIVYWVLSRSPCSFSFDMLVCAMTNYCLVNILIIVIFVILSYYSWIFETPKKILLYVIIQLTGCRAAVFIITRDIWKVNFGVWGGSRILFIRSWPFIECSGNGSCDLAKPIIANVGLIDILIENVILT